MSKLDDILKDNFDMGFIAMETSMAKEQIKALMLELIGGDEVYYRPYLVATTKKNVQWVCHMYNSMKQEYTDTEVNKFINALKKADGDF